jgi:hypothetical protein
LTTTTLDQSAAALRPEMAATAPKMKSSCAMRKKERTRGGERKSAETKCRTAWEREQTLTLKAGSVYHVRNSTCILLRAKGLNIYMYKRGRIYKEPPREIQ